MRIRKNRLLKAILGLGSLVWMNTLIAAEIEASPSNSQLVFAGKHAGMDFEGVFEHWQSTLVLPPSTQPEIKATFDLSSAKTGDRTYDSTLPEGDWFDVENHPQGVFLANDIEISDNGFWVNGTLTLKGISKPNRFELVGSATSGFSAEISVDRLEYGIGLESDPEAEWVSEEILIILTINQ